MNKEQVIAAIAAILYGSGELTLQDSVDKAIILIEYAKSASK